jgi:Mycotoxin biosynthesis protein UstYa
MFSEWRNKRPWMPLPKNHDDLDVENKLLPQDDTETSSRRSSDTQDEIRPLPKRNGMGISKAWLFLTIFNTFLVCVSVILTKMAFWDFTRACIKETSAYCKVSPEPLTKIELGRQLTSKTPIIESSQPLPFHEVKFNGTLWPMEDLSWSRREPGDPIAEAMWDSFEDMHTFPITRKQILALGKDPETAARCDSEYWGMGDDAYIAVLDTQHKMHCLNEIRKMAFADYGRGYPPVRKQRELDWIHLRHCMDMLVQVRRYPHSVCILVFTPFCQKFCS